MKYAATIITGLLCSLAIIIACMTIADVAHTEVGATQETTKATEPTYKVAETESVTEAVTEPSTEAQTEAVTEAETEAETIPEYYSVPLDGYMQDFIKSECKNKGIEPSIVIAMIERESRYDRYAIGDDGRALGLLQIHPKWHLQRMIRLGCTDLFHPYQNIIVGIDYLAELYSTYGDIGKALVAYNSGSYNGTITNYASEVMARASELERGY